jgi:glycosyltransferase involved in cell wall biosynthesis
MNVPMTETPAISVVIPSRDARAWLPQSIASIGGAAEVEIIVVDDGSTDGTAEFLARLAAADPRLVVLQGPRRGASAARNAAIAAARAPLIAFLDADDRWRLDKLAVQAALHAARPEIGFSFTDYRHRRTDGTLGGGCFAFWPRFDARHAGAAEAFVLGADGLAQIYAENVVGTSTVMARTDLLRAAGGFDESLAQAEDWDLWLRLAALAPVGCVPQALAEYRQHRPGNLSSAGAARARAMGVVAARPPPAARARSPGAGRACKARLLVAEAEAAAASGARLRAATWRMAAFILQPSLRGAREAAAAVLKPRPVLRDLVPAAQPAARQA